MKQLDGKSLDIVSQNIEKIKELFPEVFSEGKINFAKLQEELGTFAEDEAERYNFTWSGKSEAKRIAQTPSTGTLRPCKEESKDWDTTQNLYIEGDNLEVLKLLQKSYHKQVKMIYIDPPYNTGKDFVYKDNFKDNIKNYLEITGQVDSEGNRLSTNSDTNGRYHSDWLSMMYPRLKLARNLLKDDGVIFISIDDNEVANLRKLCDEIFGEDNFIANIVWEKKYTRANDAKWFSDNHDHILCYGKNKENIKLNQLPRNEEQLTAYKNPDNHEKGKWKATPLHAKSGTNRDSYTFSNGITWTPPVGTFRRFNNESMDRMDKNNEIWFGVNGEQIPQRKSFLSEIKDGVTPITLWKYEEVGHNHEANNDMKKLELGGIFSNPKPVRLLLQTLLLSTKNNTNDLILDFFSGSATTAHAVMKLNSEDGGNRKFIMVQLPEPTDNKEFPTICEIGKERIRRAGEKIIGSEVLTSPKNDGLFGGTEVPPPLDIGFKVLKLDSSNIKTWDSNFENLEQNLLDSVENIKSERTPQDLLYEILLKYGLDLTLRVEEKTLHGKKVFIIGYGALIVCLDDEITLEVVEAIAKLKAEYKSEITRVVFKDSSFADAVVKTNALQVLKQFEIDEVVSI